MVRCIHSNKRITALIAVAAVLFMMLFSHFYIAEHVSHHCEDSDNCPVCSMLLQCQRSIKSLGTGIVMAAVAFFISNFRKDVFMGYSYESTQTTLISQKVRLDS